ncbi:MAG: hypothetical protein ACYDHW_01760 [Syntrophorhabdaceae bacterium]
MNKYLIMGFSGFVGWHFVEYLTNMESCLINITQRIAVSRISLTYETEILIVQEWIGKVSLITVG